MSSISQICVIKERYFPFRESSMKECSTEPPLENAALRGGEGSRFHLEEPTEIFHSMNIYKKTYYVLSIPRERDAKKNK